MKCRSFVGLRGVVFLFLDSVLFGMGFSSSSFFFFFLTFFPSTSFILSFSL